MIHHQVRLPYHIPAYQGDGIIIDVSRKASGRKVIKEYEALRDIVEHGESRSEKSLLDSLLLRKGKQVFDIQGMTVKGAFDVRHSDNQTIRDAKVDSDPSTEESLSVLVKEQFDTRTYRMGDIQEQKEAVEVRYREVNGFILRDVNNVIDRSSTTNWLNPENATGDTYEKKGNHIAVNEKTGRVFERKRKEWNEIPDTDDYFTSFEETF